MPNIFQKLKQNFTDSSNKSTGTAKNTTSTGSLSTSQPLDEKNIKNFNLHSNNHKIKHNASISKKENNNNSSSNGAVFTINLNNNKNSQQVDSIINVNNNKENNNNSNQQVNKKSNSNMPSKKNSQSVLSLIIDSSILKESNNNETGDNNHYEDIFDPDPVQEEADTFDKVTFLDDRSFIVDDDFNVSSDNEVAKINGLARDNSCYTINEIPEGRLSKMNSSRASSRSSLGSGSTRTSSNLFEQASSDHVSSGLADMNNKLNKKTSDSGGSSSDINHDGSKNVLLDALLRKFNVNMDLVDQANKEETDLKNNQQKLIQKQAVKYVGEDHKRKQSELQKKISRNQLEKQFSVSMNESTTKIAEDKFENIDATSSYDYCPREIKVIRSTGTQMSTTSGPTSSILKQQSNVNTNNNNNNNNNINSNHNRPKQFLTASSIKLPQNFECKYIGKAKCCGLWGIKNIREPVDRLVNNAKRHKSLDDLADVEALISEKGIYIVHKPNLKEKNTKSSHSFLKSKIASATAEKTYRSGLLPISNISYAAQDNIYSKVFSCIVVQEKDSKTLSECYSFLCSRNDLAKKMALAITLAFKEYGKLLQLKESRITQTIQLNDSIYNKNNEPDSYA